MFESLLLRHAKRAPHLGALRGGEGEIRIVIRCLELIFLQIILPKTAPFLRRYAETADRLFKIENTKRVFVRVDHLGISIA
jgi:hypothetical protein